MRSDAKPLQIRVLDGDALRTLCTEPNSSKFAIDAHNRAIEEIGDLTDLPKLCSLDLSFNRLKALKNLGTARELRELKLYNNKLTTTRGLRANANLEGLFLSENQIEEISADLLALAKLKSLWLKGNRIERVENLKSCRLLVYLDLSRNRLTGSASEGLENLTSLETLNLSDNQLSAIGNLAHLTKLEDLNLGNNQMASLEGHFPPNLTVLRVHGNRISDLHSLAATLPSLNELYIQDNSLSDLEPIATRFPELESLDIRNNRVRSATQLKALSMCKALQDIWVVGNPCCSSGSYLLEISAALPELKTLDSLSDAQLQSHIEGVKNGSISSQATIPSTPRAQTPSYRPGTASRPGSSSGLGSRPATPSSGRPGTPDTACAPIFHKPSARIGNLMKLVPQSEIEKAKSDVSERLQKMKDMLQRVGTGGELLDRSSNGDALGRPQEIKPREKSQARESPASSDDTRSDAFRGSRSSTITTTSRGNDVLPGAPVAPMNEQGTSSLRNSTGAREALSTPPAQPQVRKSCVDAGTDPLESLMGNNNLRERFAVPTPSRRVAHEIETQTALPPAPVFVTSPTAAIDTKSPPDQLQRVSSTEAIQTEPEPQIDGDLIEKEMKEFLMRYATSDDDFDGVHPNNNSSAGTESTGGYSDNQDESESLEARLLGNIESPRIDPIKVAEQRQPPNPRSRQGYRSFRMPSTSRPNSSKAG